MIFGLPGSLFCRLCPAERIQITSPKHEWTVVSPVSIRGNGLASQRNQLRAQVRDASGAVIGSGLVTVSGLFGGRGSFLGTVSYSAAARGQTGTIEVFDTSPRNGAVTHLTSVDVQLG